MKRVSIFVIVVSFIFSRCDNKPVDRNSFKAEMEDREVMRVTAGQLSNFAFKKGKMILDSIQSTKVAVESDSFNTIPFKIWLEQEMNFKINQFSKNQIDTTSKLFQVYQAYAYNVENNLICEDNLQKNGEKELFITRAIVEKKDNKLILRSVLVVNMPKKDLIKKMTIKDLKN